METQDTIRKRQSTRAFKEEQIEVSTLQMILQAGCASPVGGANYKSMHFTVIQNQDFLKRFRSSAADFINKPDVNPLYGAPTFIVISSDSTNPVSYANAGCMIENMCLAATDIGIGSVYIFGCIAALNHDKQLLKELELPEGFVPVSGIALGYSFSSFEDRVIPTDRIATNYL